MKCRRSKTSRGARLRELAAAKLRKTDAVTLRHADAASAREPARNGAQHYAPPATAGTDQALAPELHIDGHSEGSVRYSGTVVVGPYGSVKGDIHATAIVVEGEVNGDLCAATSLRIGPSARVVGDLQSPRVGVARGARLRGRISMRRGLETATDLDEPAVNRVLTAAT